MKRGRKALQDPPVTWKLNLPLSLATEIELQLRDPLKGVTRKGARSELVQQLLRNWLRGHH